MRQPLSRDTSLEAEEVQLEIIRTMSVRRRLELVCELIETGRSLARAGLRRRHEGASKDEIERRLWGLQLGEALATRIWGEVPGER